MVFILLSGSLETVMGFLFCQHRRRTPAQLKQSGYPSQRSSANRERNVILLKMLTCIYGGDLMWDCCCCAFLNYSKFSPMCRARFYLSCWLSDFLCKNMVGIKSRFGLMQFVWSEWWNLLVTKGGFVHRMRHIRFCLFLLLMGCWFV